MLVAALSLFLTLILQFVPTKEKSHQACDKGSQCTYAHGPQELRTGQAQNEAGSIPGPLMNVEMKQGLGTLLHFGEMEAEG